MTIVAKPIVGKVVRKVKLRKPEMIRILTSILSTIMAHVVIVSDLFPSKQCNLTCFLA